ncbi:tetratricopeptide repeat-containing sulfotransferase family protein [Salinimonas lutimaris]|uniref:tetratricopeptide repeat-containing sulfotransferase family protein n=1 Tax=Salinimonas lutimaris TaxID=914153 RepID=UPI0010BF7CB4|nr:tetratricopeptide repeat-containing sulfotransferase family protein [Salinimonas lutimaris]
MNTQEQTQLNMLKKALMQSQYATVIAQCDDVLASLTSPEAMREARYCKAVAYRLSGQPDLALHDLQQLVTDFPDYGRAYQEQGYCYQRQGEDQNATYAFYQATRFNPALLAAWQQLEQAYQRDNQIRALQLAQQQISFLTSLPKPLLGATDLLHDGQLFKAEQVCRQYLQANKHDAEAMMLLAEIGMQLKVYSDAEFLLESCVTLYPDNDRAAAAYQALLSKLGKFPQAVKQARRRLQNQPHNMTIQAGLAHALVGVGALNEAIELYRTLLADQPARPALWVALGHALKAAGDTVGAIEAYQQAARQAPDFGDAYWSLANTKTYRFDDAMIESMVVAQHGSTVKLEDNIHLCFALGKALEDNKQADQAFSYYQRGNALKRKTLRFDISRTEAALEAQQQACQAPMFAQPGGCHAPDPIFIVGLPRAGSTLLEQILASHSMVDGTMELHDILGIANSLSHQGNAYPFNLARLSDAQCQALGQQYIEQTRAYRNGAPFFIDKMPNNFIHIGLIKRILPKARIIDARRDPVACCFSGYKQLFGEGQEFSYSLRDIGRYYIAYEKLMNHWHRVLPGQILTVQHEAVIDDLTGQVKRLLAFCELPFEQACVDFHVTRRVIKTPSSEQVRQPIYRSGMTQWQQFEAHLGPLFDVLGQRTNR